MVKPQNCATDTWSAQLYNRRRNLSTRSSITPFTYFLVLLCFMINTNEQMYGMFMKQIALSYPYGFASILHLMSTCQRLDPLPGVSAKHMFASKNYVGVALRFSMELLCMNRRYDHLWHNVLYLLFSHISLQFARTRVEVNASSIWYFQSAFSAAEPHFGCRTGFIVLRVNIRNIRNPKLDFALYSSNQYEPLSGWFFFRVSRPVRRVLY